MKAAPHPLHLLLRCSNTLLREAGRLLARHELTAAQFNVLNLVDLATSGARPSEIANDLVVDPSSATYIIKQLRNSGLLNRSSDPVDRRAYRLTLSTAGRRKLERARATYFPVLAELTDHLPPKDLEALQDTLGRLLEVAPDLVETALNALDTPGP